MRTSFKGEKGRRRFRCLPCHWSHLADMGVLEMNCPRCGRSIASQGVPLIDRFLAKVEITPSCWLWRGAMDGKGYGNFGAGETGTVKAYKWAFEFYRFVVPEGFELDHLCRNRACVKPDHLEPVTHQVNMSRARKTHCPAGHTYNRDNTWIGDGERHCRICDRDRKRAKRLAREL